MPYQQEIKGIKLLQDRADVIQISHSDIGSDLASLKATLMLIEGAEAIVESDEFIRRKQEASDNVTSHPNIEHTSIITVYAEAEARYTGRLGLSDILDIDDFGEAQKRIDRRVLDFNHRYGLDGWDYAISGGCGLFAAMLDLLCVRAPLKPTQPWTEKTNGIFNRWVQEAFNRLLPPETSGKLSESFKIYSADCSTIGDLIGAPGKVINPTNHRLRALAHDPVLGFIFGVWDMMHGTCTVVYQGKITSIPSKKDAVDGNLFQLLGRMMGHLLSDVNAPSVPNGNRGMGLPAPFMGILRMFEGVPVGDSNFGSQIEYMYAKGYDFRQFMATSIPIAIMEVMLRSFYVVKQMKIYNAPFAESLLETMPGRMNPRFRMMLGMAYGTSSAVNAGKMYVTKDILNANYASWMGLAWNGFHSLKWALLERHLKLWDGILNDEIAQIQDLTSRMADLEERARQLPT
jgi:hypothetical protein